MPAAGRDRGGAYAAARFEDTDWPQIAALYRELTRWDPSPVIEINRAAAVGMADGPRAGLAILEPVLISGTSRPKRRSTPPMLTCLSARVRPTRPLQPGHEPLRQPGTRRSARNYSAAAAKLEASSAVPARCTLSSANLGRSPDLLPGRARPPACSVCEGGREPESGRVLGSKRVMAESGARKGEDHQPYRVEAARVRVAGVKPRAGWPFSRAGISRAVQPGRSAVAVRNWAAARVPGTPSAAAAWSARRPR